MKDPIRVKAGKRSRAAGQRFERECWHMLRRLWPKVIPTRQVVRNTTLKVPDIDGEGCPFWIEVGYRSDIEALDLLPVKYEQAHRDAAGSSDTRSPLVIVKQARREALIGFWPESLQAWAGDWLVVRRDAVSFHEWRRWSVLRPTPFGARVVAVTWSEFLRLLEPRLDEVKAEP